MLAVVALNVIDIPHVQAVTATASDNTSTSPTIEEQS